MSITIGGPVDSHGKVTVTTPITESQAGFVQLSSEVDSGTVTGSRYTRALEASTDYRLRTGLDSPMFNLSFEGTVVAQDRISQASSTMTIVQTNGQLTINSANATASGNYASIKSYRTFPLLGSYTTYIEIWAQVANDTATNAVSEFGVGYASAATEQMTDGLVFRHVPGGALKAILIFNGNNVVETTITTTSIPSRDGVGTYSASEFNHYLIAIHNDEVEFWINDTLVCEMSVPSTQGSPTSAMAQPIMARVINTGVASAARKIVLGFINVTMGDANMAKPWGHIMCGLGGGSYQTQPGGASGPTLTRGAAQTGWPASTTAQTALTFTATTAPAIGSLGGWFYTPAVSTMAAETDYPIFSYLNPAGTATLAGRTMYVTGIRLSELIARAAASTNTSLWMFAVGVGSTASATTATEGAAVVAARLVPIGQVFWSATTAIGDTKGGWTLDFSSAPLVVPSGTYLQLIMRQIGTVTSNTLQAQGLFTVIGYFE